MRWFAGILAWSVLCVGLPQAEAEPGARPEVVGIRVGIGGKYKAGLWTPVEVRLRGGSQAWLGQLAAVVPDGDGAPCRFACPADGPLRVGPGQSTSAMLYVKFGRTEPTLTIELRESESVVVERVFAAGATDGESIFARALASTDGLIVGVGPQALAVEETFAGLRQLAGGRTVAAGVADATELPSHWCGYEGADIVVLATGDPKSYAGLKSEGPQVLALEQWVRMGGTVLLCAGRNAEVLLAPDAPLARFAPGRLVRTLPLRQSSAIEAYCSSSVPLPRERVGGRLDLRVPQFAEVEGTVEAREGNLPLVVRRTLGFGTVVFAALDPEMPPLRDWADRRLLLDRLLDVDLAPPEDARASGVALHYGFDDVAGQLRSALDQFSHVPFIPFWIVVALVVGYLVLIGPVDYFFLHRVAGRMTLTWITFPLIVTAFCMGAYVLAHRLKGDRVRLNQVDLVDVDLVSGQMRGTSWATMFSPRAERCDVRFAPRDLSGAEAVGAEVVASWLGLPGEAFGGMNPKTAPPAVWKDPYDCSRRLDALDGVPMQIWSTKSFNARWTAKTSAKPEARIVEQDRVPVGTITNTLDVPLSECLLCYKRWAYRLGDLGPGESAQVGASSERRDLTTLLTGRRFLFEEGVEQATPYDRGSVDVAYIVRAMMFFEAAGGSRYTGLVHRHHGFVDVSDLLRTDHAVLVAVGPAGDPESPYHGSRLVRDGTPLVSREDRHTTIYRFVLPVGRE